MDEVTAGNEDCQESNDTYLCRLMIILRVVRLRPQIRVMILCGGEEIEFDEVHGLGEVTEVNDTLCANICAILGSVFVTSSET